MDPLEDVGAGGCGSLFSPVLGWNGLYSVCACGRVFSHLTERILRPHIADTGYSKVMLHGNGAKTCVAIHRVVYEAHKGPIPPRFDINHLDGLKTNNRAENLEAVTRKGNMVHAVANGLFDTKGSRHWNAKLSDADVLDIVRLYEGGARVGEIANAYPVSHSQVSMILSGRSWSHLTGLFTNQNRSGRACRQPTPR
jgi:hypothetical protein